MAAKEIFLMVMVTTWPVDDKDDRTTHFLSDPGTWSVEMCKAVADNLDQVYRADRDTNGSARCIITEIAASRAGTAGGRTYTDLLGGKSEVENAYGPPKQ
ncbi:MAG: hypothetical protein RLW87_20455 [Alphaproteobacteria bacterium]